MNLCLKLFVREKSVCFCQVGKDVFSCFTICSQALDVSIDLSVEGINVVLMFSNLQMNFCNLQVQVCGCGIGLHKVNIDQGNQE